MPKVKKHGRKRQKLAQDVEDAYDPLEDDTAKDDEERRLESLLFGKKFTPRAQNDELVIQIDDDEDEEDEGDAGGALRNLLDTDLFAVDVDPDSEGHPSEEEDADSDAEDDIPTVSIPKRAGKAPAWTDPFDPVTVNLISPSNPNRNRLRKLRDAPGETELSGREYESRLRREFERINARPAWASGSKKKGKKAGSDEEDEEDIDVNVDLSGPEGILDKGSRKRKGTLSAGRISIARLRDVNHSTQESASGDIKSIAWHPSERIPVLAVGTMDRRVRLYNVDGHTSPLLHTIHIPSLPLTSQSSVTFHPSGNSILLTGNRPYYMIYDLQKGTVTNSGAKALWSDNFTPTSVLNTSKKRSRTNSKKTGSKFGKGGADGAGGMHVHAFSPTGSLFAVAAPSSQIHLLDFAHPSSQPIATLKCSAPISSLWFSNSTTLAALTEDAQVLLWDVGERKCVRKWNDVGGFRGGGGVLAGSNRSGANGDEGWLAIGSRIGLVNVYEGSSYSPSVQTPPEPRKTLSSLTTSISTLAFNHDAQILAMASKDPKDGFRLVHTPTLTTFSNFPTSSTPLGHVTCVGFSARSEYLAVGNTRGKVLLWGLQDYTV